jgi:hypothetical protein
VKPSLLVVLLLAWSASARADSFDPRVMVMPVGGEAPKALGKLGRDVMDALAKGARDSDAEVARADATLADTAGIVGCDPAEPACVDAVAAALNVDQLLIAEMSIYPAGGDDAMVEVTAVTRETQPLSQTFPVRKDSRRADLKAIREAVGRMLEEGEVRRAQAIAEPEPAEDEGAAPVRPVEAPERAVDPEPVAEGPRRASRGPVILAVSGGVLAVVGATFWALAASAQGDVDDAPTATAADLDALVELEDRASFRAGVGNVLVVVGAVAAAAGGVWWWHDRTQRERAVTVTALPGGAGVAFGGAW